MTEEEEGKVSQRRPVNWAVRGGFWFNKQQRENKYLKE